MAFEPTEHDSGRFAHPGAPFGDKAGGTFCLFKSFIGACSVIVATPTAAFSTWWWLNQHGTFMRGCNGQAVLDVWNLIGRYCMASAGLATVLGFSAILLGQRYRGCFAVAVGLVFLVAFAFSQNAVC